MLSFFKKYFLISFFCLLNTLPVSAKDVFNQTAKLLGQPTLENILQACNFSNMNIKKQYIFDKNHLPKQIVVDLKPYLSVQQALSEQNKINWYKHKNKANSITQAYAAQELQTHLKKINIDLPIVDLKPENQATSSIILTTNANLFARQAANNLKMPSLLELEGVLGILPAGSNLYVFGQDRKALLSGVYRLLEMWGFAWYDPDEVTLPPRENVTIKDIDFILERPKLKFRGYWTWTEDFPIPDKFSIWVARNRLNIIGGVRPVLAGKLGLNNWGGGHNIITETFANQQLYNEKPEWYAQIQGNKWYSWLNRSRRIVDDMTNPNFSNRNAAEYFAEKVIERLATGDLQYVDVLNLWPADHPSATVWHVGEDAQAIGNHTDNLLYFYLIVTEKIAEARKAGVLQRPVTIAGISYYITWEPPTNLLVLKKLAGLDYLHIFYTNERMWSSIINKNLGIYSAHQKLVDQLTVWKTLLKNPMGIVEYHNYSFYGALAIDEFNNLPENHQYLTADDMVLYAYMHPLLQNAGPRRLLNKTIANLAWQNLLDSSVSEFSYAEEVRKTRQKYFLNRYKNYAEKWCEIHTLMSYSLQNAAEMFAHHSLETLLLQAVFWADPHYTAKESLQYIQRYLVGGFQHLPNLMGASTDVVSSDFLGLQASIQLQKMQQQRWVALMQEVKDITILNNMRNDVLWFSATVKRYELLAELAVYYQLYHNGGSKKAINQSVKKIHEALLFLEKSPTTQDAVSPVDQSLRFDFYRKLLCRHQNNIKSCQPEY